VKSPDYVPPAVQKYIAALLYGSDGTRGWANAANGPGSEYIAEIVAFLKRFENPDEAIREMFRHLDDAKLSEADQKQFMNAAWASRTDFAKYRAAEKKAAKLNQDIAIKAEELARLLDEIQGYGLSDVPMEFYDLRTLLLETDNRRDLVWWPVNRHHLLGQSYVLPNDKGAPASAPKVIARKNVTKPRVTKPDPAAQVRADIVYAWGIAPSLADLLGTVAKAASNYEPKFYGAIGAAVGSQKPNAKTEFIRAIWHWLDKARIPPTRPVLKAIACMTTVALDDPDTIATYEDVRQALGFKKKASG
jgi:hypothetical protein